jgi:hypothetical protein
MSAPSIWHWMALAVIVVLLFNRKGRIAAVMRAFSERGVWPVVCAATLLLVVLVWLLALQLGGRA